MAGTSSANRRRRLTLLAGALSTAGFVGLYGVIAHGTADLPGSTAPAAISEVTGDGTAVQRAQNEVEEHEGVEEDGEREHESTTVAPPQRVSPRVHTRTRGS